LIPLGVLLSSFVAAHVVMAAETVAPAPPQRAASQVPSEPEISEWVAELDADRFDVRQRAQQRLEAAGKPALAVVAETARDGSLESSTRAINILLNWAESRDNTFRLATLEKIMNLPNRPREAAMATRLLAEVREQAAIEEIKKLGGEVIERGGSVEISLDKKWKGGDAGLKHLADVARPTSITLRLAEVTEPGILEHITKVPQPYQVLIYGIPFPEESVAKLKQQLPTARQIEARNGAMLGILGSKTDPIRDSVAVSDVVIDGAAHKAGVLPGDRITHLDGEKLTDFDSLTTRIATYKAGDSAKLTIQRKGKNEEVTVKFDHWGGTDNKNLMLQQSRNIPQQVPIRMRINGGQIQRVPKR